MHCHVRQSQLSCYERFGAYDLFEVADAAIAQQEDVFFQDEDLRA